jgi:ATP-dependent Lhr-like helicase
MLRSNAPWLRAPAALRAEEPADEPGVTPRELGPAAAALWTHLSRAGASFLADLVHDTGLSADDIEEGLWELVAGGLASADGFAALRVLVDRRRGETRSHFDKGRAPEAPKTRSWQDAVKKARGRDQHRPAHALRTLPTAVGRWSLLGAPRADAMDAEASARQLLARYGVVFRDLVTRESTLPPWRELLVALRRLEARGEIRGGRFVAGFVGEQFALGEAVDELRAARQTAPNPELVRVAATDPCNLVGVLSPGPRVPAVLGNAVLYKDGVPIASLESGALVVRAALEPGARVDPDLSYHAPPRREPVLQVSLPL